MPLRMPTVNRRSAESFARSFLCRIDYAIDERLLGTPCGCPPVRESVTRNSRDVWRIAARYEY